MEEVEGFKLEGVGMGKGVTVQKLQMNKIKIAKNSRLDIKDDEIAGLMLSIKEEGLLQPIGVIKNGSGFNVCYGNRRFLACSKLGLSHIAAIVHVSEKESDADIKNLTENIQRRNISLQEAGRYFEILKGQGLTKKEMAARIGVTESYVASCISAYQEVPKEFRNDLELRIKGDKKTTYGKIAIKTARKIITAGKTMKLSESQIKELFKASKKTDEFQPESVNKYALALKNGHKNVFDSVEKLKYVRFQFCITEKHHAELMAKYVDSGPFNSMTDLLTAILRGGKAVRIDVKNNF